MNTDKLNTFSIRDLRERTGELVRTAEDGKLSIVAKHGHPVFLAVPFSGSLLRNGIGVALAIQLYDNDTLSLGRAAKMANMSHEEFMSVLGSMGISVVRYSEVELDDEVDAFLA